MLNKIAETVDDSKSGLSRPLRNAVINTTTLRTTSQ